MIKHSGITSGAGSLVTNMLNIQNYSGMNKTQISQVQTFNSLICGLASNTQIVYTAHKSGMDNAATALRMRNKKQLAMGITLGHEAYRDGNKGTQSEQDAETVAAVKGHTELTEKVLQDETYTKIRLEF